ncbi:MAG: hypothetical protein J7L16_03475 [Deltaproteobacteria bacterium]|nr:hypothetical protein [Deltaproteobacteria bacterium]
MVGPRGEVEVKAAIIYDGIAVAVLHFNPSDGLLLPFGISPVETGVSPQVIESVKPQPTRYCDRQVTHVVLGGCAAWNRGADYVKLLVPTLAPEPGA